MDAGPAACDGSILVQRAGQKSLIRDSGDNGKDRQRSERAAGLEGPGRAGSSVRRAIVYVTDGLAGQPLSRLVQSNGEKTVTRHES